MSDDRQAIERNALGALIARQEQRQGEVQRHLHLLVHDVAAADANRDGTIDGNEIAQMLANPKGFAAHTGELAVIRQACSNLSEVGQREILAATASFGVNNILNTLNNPQDAKKNAAANATILTDQIAKLAEMTGGEMDPKNREWFQQKTSEVILQKNERLITAYVKANHKGQLGDLPLQATPVSAKQLCDAVNPRTT